MSGRKRAAEKRRKWTKDACIAEAKKYKTKTEFLHGSPGAHDAARKQGWLKEFNWFEDGRELGAQKITKWTYEICMAEAKKYVHPTDFENGSNGAYNKARKEGWLKDYTWIVPKTKPHGWWNEEHCREEAKKYHRDVDFKQGSPSAHQAAERHGWLKTYDWFDRKPHPDGYWTRERCLEEMLKYETVSDFIRGSSGAYNAARKKGWLEDREWKSGFARTAELNRKWTEETCRDEAKKYKSRSEFAKYGRGAYMAANDNGWLDSYTWFVPSENMFVNGENVYTYTFPPVIGIPTQSVYVGLTTNPKKRDYQHRTGSGDSRVHEFAVEHGVDIPEMELVAEKVSATQAKALEHEWECMFREEGLNVLNRARTGVYSSSLGMLHTRKWTEEKCLELAKTCRTRTEMKKKSNRAYRVAMENGWILNYTWFENGNAWSSGKRQKKYTEEFLTELASHCTGRGDFKNRNPNAYTAARLAGLLDKLFPETRHSVKSGTWNSEAACREEAGKYKSRSEFCRGCPGAYQSAREHGWLDSYTWFEWKCMPRNYWTKERCEEEARKYKTKADFEHGCSTACRKAVDNGWMQGYTWFVDGRALAIEKTRKWTKETCREEAKKYKNRWEFSRGSGRAYHIAMTNGWIDEIMPKTPARPVIQIDPETGGTVRTWEDTGAARKAGFMNIHRSISHGTPCKGYLFRYVE